MALDPKLLFFDEPSAGLDPVSSASLDELILQIREKTGATIVIVTHELDSIFRVSDRSIMLDAVTKRILAEGKPEDLRKNCANEEVRRFLNRGKL
jgi:phospholipid/cholesterol/gamma-HCH transport system ATP-binding protein